MSFRSPVDQNDAMILLASVHVALLWRILSYALRSFDTRDIHFGMLKVRCVLYGLRRSWIALEPDYRL